jgi:hypothetical protein
MSNALNPFGCENEGCFDSVEYQAVLSDGYLADLCEPCLDYLINRGLVAAMDKRNDWAVA